MTDVVVERANEVPMDTGGIAGHPKGLMTLFLTEMWERFSYYGMRALLILYMKDTVEHGGLGWAPKDAGFWYGLYVFFVYVTAIPGGWLADRFLGQQRSVIIGGVIIALGHFCLAFDSLPMFATGLVLIVIGTGFLKPNISTIVGQLYRDGDPRRDAGFSIFYMGINMGAFFGAIVCGLLAKKLGWHYGFAAAGICMTAGVIQYIYGRKHLGEAGLHPSKAESTGGSLPIGALVRELAYFGIAWWTWSKLGADVADAILLFIALTSAEMFWSFLRQAKNPDEKKRIWSIAVLFIFATLFWGAFEQAGSSLNIFANDHTRDTFFGIEYPITWFQSVNSLFLWMLAPLFAWLWLRLGKKEPSSPTKFAFGLIFVGLGFLVLAWGSTFLVGGFKVGPGWLIVLYLLHTIGELCLSPVGLSTVTKLAPKQIAGSMMGIWFLAIAIGGFLGGRVASKFEEFPLPKLFGTVFLTTLAAAIVLFFLVKPIRRLMGDVH